MKNFGGDQQTSDSKGSETRTEATVPTESSGDADEKATAAETEAATELPEPDTELYIDPDGVYTSMEDVALCLYLYSELPENET